MNPPDIPKDAEIRDYRERESIIKNPLVAVLVAISIAAIYLYFGFYISTPLKFARAKFSNIFYPLRIRYYRAVDSDYLRPKDIVMLKIDEESYKHFGVRWPWSRKLFADILDKLIEYNPKVIALDFALWGRTADDPEADIKLAEAMKRCGNVIVAAAYGEEKFYLAPYEVLADACMDHGVIGAIKDEDLDSAVRSLRISNIIFDTKKSGDISYEIKVAARYLGLSYDWIHQEDFKSIVLKSEGRNTTILADEKGHMLINYLSDEEDIDTFSVWKVMEGEIPKEALKDKIALLSRTGEIYKDIHLTPLGYRSGGLIIANSVNMIVTSNYLKDVNPNLIIPLMIMLYIGSFILFYKVQPLKGFLALTFILSAYLTTSFAQFLNNVAWPIFDILMLLTFLFLGMTFYKHAVVVVDSVRLKRLSITDSLTSLYTHRYFRFLLDHTTTQTVNFKQRCSLVVIRVLNLDKIVKEISFNRGQLVQQKMAELIRLKLTKNSCASYLGMGEFSMLMPKVGPYEALGIAGSLRDRVEMTDFGIREDVLKPSVAIGVSAVDAASFPKTGIELMRSARAAMARAKELGYNKICKFNPKIDSSVFEPDIIEKQIRQRLDDAFSFLALDLEERNKELEDLLRQLSITQRDLEHAHFETLRSLVVALEEKDPYTAGHSERVGTYAEKIGREFRMPEEELRLLRQAGVLHDIGKVGIPQNILRKEDKLDPSERHIVELHPEFSVRILNTSQYFNRILHAIRDHHERLDGKGYPRGLKGDQISLEAQIISICDVFDAMTTDRPYRKALTSQEALDELTSHPEGYNEKVTRALQKVLSKEEKTQQ